MTELLKCILCGTEYRSDQILYRCPCSERSLLELHRPSLTKDFTEKFDQRRRAYRGIDVSGVWTFREGVLAASEDQLVTYPEGRTRLHQRPTLNQYADIKSLYFKHEGENPTGSFKDRGMTVAVTKARQLGAKLLGCASTGNTSASLAAYAAMAGLPCVVFLPKGKIASGKLAQALAFGAHCLTINGDFDCAMDMAMKLSHTHGLYLVNSINPFRLEGQKTIIWELLQDLNWQTPDWIIVPGGNLGNTSAFGKALSEALANGWIDRLPRIATVQAEGANPFYQSFQADFAREFHVQAETIATAVRIGKPVNYRKAIQAIRNTNGVVIDVSDAEILSAKAVIDSSGIGCEPASACSLAGTRKLKSMGIIQAGQSVVCILTGHILKDPEIILDQEPLRQRIIEVEGKERAIGAALDRLLQGA